MSRTGDLQKENKTAQWQGCEDAVDQSPAQTLYTAQAISTVLARHISH
jgi:hypothetical protein